LRLLIDTDIGCDDAVALVLALRTAGVTVDALTTVAGNAPLADTTRNALYTLEVCGEAVPVYPGAEAPLIAPPPPPRGAHGTDGLGDLGLRPRHARPRPQPADEALIEQSNAGAGESVLVSLGPPTNLAHALQRDPLLPRRVRRCVVSGGSLADPPEFNLSYDPEAARLVLRAGFDLTLVPLDLSRGDARLAPDDYLPLLESRDPVAHVAGLMCRFLGERGRRYGWSGEAALPDAVAMAAALQPDLLETEGCCLDVDIGNGPARGALLVHAPNSGPATVRLGRRLDTARFKAMLLAALQPRARQ